MANIVDSINIRTMRSADAVQSYSYSEALTPAEQASLESVKTAARNKPILDIGVGAGRTVRPLREVSQDYLGIDNSPEMLAVCFKKYPEARLEHADARDLAQVRDASIFLVMFSCNGIGMVVHEDRLSIMREVFRVLQPGGVFLFSTHNQNSPDHVEGFQFPDFETTRNPARLLIRTARFVKDTLIRANNRYRHGRHDIRMPEYSMINDVCHNYATMLYYIALANQRQQLKQIGFQPDALAFDSKGCVIIDDCTDSSIAFVAMKPEVCAS